VAAADRECDDGLIQLFFFFEIGWLNTAGIQPEDAHLCEPCSGPKPAQQEAVLLGAKYPGVVSSKSDNSVRLPQIRHKRFISRVSDVVITAWQAWLAHLIPWS